MVKLSYFQKRRKFNSICRDIKSIKIQGARNIAKSALYAYSLFPKPSSKKKLIKLRPTEPMLFRVLEEMDKNSYKEVLSHFDSAQEKINKAALKLIKKNYVIFTHCHSTNVTGALIYAKKKGKKFEIYNTETRPLFQGRKTARELKREKIKVTMFIDSAINVALDKKQGTKNVDVVFIGADALTKDGVINKVGSSMISQLAKLHNIPVYVIADSWKFSKTKIPIEQRSLNEVWDKAPKNIKIRNPAFEFVPKKLVKGVVSEFGVLSYGEFLKEMKK
ncbi:translation initiation factor eIF-2B [Candidatus Pacearchaeota archaeon]|nr:translation initiation factor eIF-2B [Candidatus Pacearchaeota archaeon]